MLTELAIQRLKEAGWTPGREVDISKIEEAYAKAGMVIPEPLRAFFKEFGFLGISYDIQHIEMESHYFSPLFDFYNYEREDFEHLFEVAYEIYGTVYPVGSACRGNMTIYYHDDGCFYLYMGGGPLIRCGHSVESFLNGLFGGEAQDWKSLDE